MEEADMKTLDISKLIATASLHAAPTKSPAAAEDHFTQTAAMLDRAKALRSVIGAGQETPTSRALDLLIQREPHVEHGAESVIADLFADLRHLSDLLGCTFSEAVSYGFGIYSTDLRGESMASSPELASMFSES